MMEWTQMLGPVMRAGRFLPAQQGAVQTALEAMAGQLELLAQQGQLQARLCREDPEDFADWLADAVCEGLDEETALLYTRVAYAAVDLLVDGWCQGK